MVCIIICRPGWNLYGLVLYNLEKSKSIKRTNKEQSMFYHIDIFSLTHLYYSFVGTTPTTTTTTNNNNNYHNTEYLDQLTSKEIFLIKNAPWGTSGWVYRRVIEINKSNVISKYVTYIRVNQRMSKHMRNANEMHSTYSKFVVLNLLFFDKHHKYIWLYESLNCKTPMKH